MIDVVAIVSRLARWWLFAILIFSVAYGLIAFLYPVAMLAVLKDGSVALLVLLSITAAAVRFKSRASRFAVLINSTAVLIALWALLAAQAGVDTGAPLLEAILDWRFYGLYALVVLVPGTALRARKDVVSYLRLVVEVGTIAALIGLTFYAFPALDITNHVAQIRSGIAERAVVGTLGNRPNMGIFCVLVFAATFSARGYFVGRYVIVAQAILIVATLLTFSRTSYAALAFCILVSQFTLTAKRRHLRIAAISAGLIAAVAWQPVMIAPVERAVASVDPTLSGRTALWDDFGYDFGILGNGLGHLGGTNTLLASTSVTPSARTGAVDNQLLKMAVDMGFGVILFVLLLGLALTMYYRQLRYESLASGPFLQLIAMSVVSFGVDWVHIAPVALMFWIAIGLAPVLRRSTPHPITPAVA